MHQKLSYSWLCLISLLYSKTLIYREPRLTLAISFPKLCLQLNMYHVNKQNPDSPRLFIPPKLTVSWGFTAYNFLLIACKMFLAINRSKAITLYHLLTSKIKMNFDYPRDVSIDQDQ